jgi:hypothetical protein
MTFYYFGMPMNMYGQPGHRIDHHSCLITQAATYRANNTNWSSGNYLTGERQILNNITHANDINGQYNHMMNPYRDGVFSQ